MSDPVQEIARQLHITTFGDGLMAKIRLTIDLLQEAANERDQLRAELEQQRGGDEKVLRQLLGSVLCYVERDIERMRGDREKAEDKGIYDRTIAQATERLMAAINAVFTTEPGCKTAAALKAQQRGGVVDERDAFEAEFPRVQHAPAAYWCEDRQRYIGHGDAFENNGSAYQKKFETWKARAALTAPAPGECASVPCPFCGKFGEHDPSYPHPPKAHARLNSSPVSAGEIPFAGFDPNFCPGSNPENPQEPDEDEARHDAVKALHDVMQAVPCASLYSLAEAVLDAGYMKPVSAGGVDERVAFEAEFENTFYSACFERHENGDYVGRGLQGAWLGWQARAALTASAAPSAAPAPGECVAVPRELLERVIDTGVDLLNLVESNPNGPDSRTCPGCYGNTSVRWNSGEIVDLGEIRHADDCWLEELHALLAQQGKAVGDE